MVKLSMDLIYKQQLLLQRKLIGKEDVASSVKAYVSATAAMVELGEMIQEDTRWKAKLTGSKKVGELNVSNYMEEAADVLLYLFNALIHEGVAYDDFAAAVFKKQTKNLKRLVP